MYHVFFCHLTIYYPIYTICTTFIFTISRVDIYVSTISPSRIVHIFWYVVLESGIS